jgi:AcrR family transcriptional regulator
MLQPTMGQSSPPDGRALRSERTRSAIADALLALIEEGELRPTAPRVAERAGVSLRSVFQHFADMEALYATVAEHQMERQFARAALIPRDGPLDARIDVFVAQRARLHEAVAPVRRAALLHEPFSTEVARRLDWVRRRGRTEVARVFAIELGKLPQAARRDQLEAITVASSWSNWEALRAHQGLSRKQAERVLRMMLQSLLARNDKTRVRHGG